MLSKHYIIRSLHLFAKTKNLTSRNLSTNNLLIRNKRPSHFPASRTCSRPFFVNMWCEHGIKGTGWHAEPSKGAALLSYTVASVEYDNKIGQTSDRGAFVRTCVAFEAQEGRKTRGRASLVRKKEKTERTWTDGPPRLPAIMSRSRKLAAPSSIMPSSYIVMCDQIDLLFVPVPSPSSSSSSSFETHRFSSCVFSILFRQRRLSRAQSLVANWQGKINRENARGRRKCTEQGWSRSQDP